MARHQCDPSGVEAVGCRSPRVFDLVVTHISADPAAVGCPLACLPASWPLTYRAGFAWFMLCCGLTALRVSAFPYLALRPSACRLGCYLVAPSALFGVHSLPGFRFETAVSSTRNGTWKCG